MISEGGDRKHSREREVQGPTESNQRVDPLFATCEGTPAALIAQTLRLSTVDKQLGIFTGAVRDLPQGSISSQPRRLNPVGDQMRDKPSSHSDYDAHRIARRNIEPLFAGHLTILDHQYIARFVG